jgi:glycosyltransferase involved in cell wall biosynthesis
VGRRCCWTASAAFGISIRLAISTTVIVVVDGPADPTLPFVVGYADSRLRYQLTRECHGTADAIRAGLAAARANVIVVTTPDGGDDLRQIDDLTRLVERGCAIAAASLPSYLRWYLFCFGPRLTMVSCGRRRRSCRSCAIATNSQLLLDWPDRTGERKRVA